MNTDYTFVSYAHKDKVFVENEIARREKDGQVFWYDRSIEAGSDWARSIADSLAGASSVLYFRSPASLASENCRRELSYAEENNIPVETVIVPAKKKAGLFACVAAIIILLIAGYFTLINHVPSVIGSTISEGQQTISEAGFETYTDYDYSDEYGFGYIADQNHNGTTLGKPDIVLIQSLGPNRSLQLMPDIVGSYISDGIRLLIQSGFEKFSIIPEIIENEFFGEITEQSAPAGYMISSENTIVLSVATNKKYLQFEYDGRIITVDENGLEFTGEEIKTLGLSHEEMDLFNENNKHQVYDFLLTDHFKNAWLPAECEDTIKNNPDTAYGWVIVRNTELSAEDLFRGYCEIYVCPGITVTISGIASQTEGYSDFYVASGGTLIFSDGIKGGANICNDGTTIIHGDYDGGESGLLAYNRGTMTADGAYKGELKLFSFENATVEGSDETNIGISQYVFDGYPFYEGVTGPDGMFAVTDGFLRLNKYISAYGEQPVHSFKGSWYPIFRAEQLSRDGTQPDNFYGYVIVEDMEASDDWYFHSFRSGAAEFNVASGVTFTIPNGLDITTLNIHVDKDAKLIFNADISIKGDYGGELAIFNFGETEINGNLKIDSPVYWSNIVNCGKITGTGSVSGSCLNIFTFKDCTSAIDFSDVRKIYSYNYVPDFAVSGFEDHTPKNIWNFIHAELKKDGMP